MLACVFISTFLVLNHIYNHPEILRPISNVPLDKPINKSIFSMGVFDGVVTIMSLFYAMLAIMWFFTRKTVCLLIKYYNKLNFAFHGQSTSNPRPIEKSTVKQKNTIEKPAWSWLLKKKTDTEYIESYRKNIPWLTSVIVMTGMAACSCACSPLLFYQQIRYFDLAPQSIYIGFIFGIIYGLIMAAGAFFLYFAVAALCNYRTERLLVQYYDELNRRPNQPSRA